MSTSVRHQHFARDSQQSIHSTQSHAASQTDKGHVGRVECRCDCV